MEQPALQPTFDWLSDELFDLIINECGGNSLTVLLPRVAKRWGVAAARVLQTLVHLDARFMPMREWPRDLTSNSLKLETYRPFSKTDVEKRKDENERMARQWACEFSPEAYKMRHCPRPQPLRLARYSSADICGRKYINELWEVRHPFDCESGIEQRFHHEAADDLNVLARNLRFALSKMPHLERLEIVADLYDDGAPPERHGMYLCTWRHLSLRSCLPDPVAARLVELTVFGKFSNDHAIYLAAACPNLEKLHYDVILNCSPAVTPHEGWDLDAGGLVGLGALMRLKAGCPKLTTLPLIEMHRGKTSTKIVSAFFALLTQWAALRKVLVHSYMYHPLVMASAEAFERNRGSFGGKLCVMCGYDDEDEIEFWQDNEQPVDQPHVSVHMHCCLG